MKLFLAHLYNDLAKFRVVYGEYKLLKRERDRDESVSRRGIDHALIEGSLREARRR